MKNWLVWMLLLAGVYSRAQNADQDAREHLMENDSLFWVGYNSCNLELMAQFLSKDMEFYHDKGGITLGIEGMNKAMRENICRDKSNKVRRELVPGTMELYLLKNNDTLYGAIISGAHAFYNSQEGGEESKGTTAKFTNLWLLYNGSWKMHRILSFDH